MPVLFAAVNISPALLLRLMGFILSVAALEVVKDHLTPLVVLLKLVGASAGFATPLAQLSVAAALAILQLVLQIRSIQLTATATPGSPFTVKLPAIDSLMVVRVLGASLWLALGTAIGLLLFIVPGVLFALNRCLVFFPIVLEHSTIRSALQRSKELIRSQTRLATLGEQFRIFAAFFLLSIAAAIPLLLLTVAIAAASLFSPTAEMALRFILQAALQALQVFLNALLTLYFLRLINTPPATAPLPADLSRNSEPTPP